MQFVDIEIAHFWVLSNTEYNIIVLNLTSITFLLKELSAKDRNGI